MANYIEKKQTAFIHIPKTGGTYLAQRETGDTPVISPLINYGHTYIVDDLNHYNILYAYYDEENANKSVRPRSSISNIYIVSIVRNIFSWLVSYYVHAGGFNKRYCNPKHYDFQDAQKGFDYLLQTIVNRDDIWPNRKFIFAQLFSSAGDLIIDWLCRQETLDNDLNLLSKKRDLIYKKKTLQRVGGYSDYKSFYSNKLIDLVNKTWERELSLFGYGFDDNNIDESILSGEIATETKSSIKYIWNLDCLIIDGVINESKAVSSGTK